MLVLMFECFVIHADSFGGPALISYDVVLYMSR